MRTLKFALTLFLVILLQSCNQPLQWNASDISGMMPDLEFTLTGPDGAPVNANSLHGKPVVLFFGFTSCPDLCPTTLTRLSVLIKALGPQANDLQVVFASVDPDRDTYDVRKRYTASLRSWLLRLSAPRGHLTR